MSEDETDRFRRLCNALANITQVMGEEGVLQLFDPDYDSRRDINRSQEDGIYFNATRRSNSGHFVARKDGNLLDSYTLRYQQRGSNGFCQTFAIMNYTGNTGGLKTGEYGHNGYAALCFIEHCLKSATKTQKQFYVNAYASIDTFDGYYRTYASLLAMVQELIATYEGNKKAFQRIIQTEITYDFA